MNKSVRIGLLLGAVMIVAGTGLAFAQMEGPTPPDGSMQGLMRGHGHGRLADRLLESFDKNHDGKVSHDEMNRAIYAKFVATAHGAQAVTLDQFVASHEGEFRQHAAEMFHRIDWRGSGKLSLEDFAAPQRARLMMMDKDGSGYVSCASSPSRFSAGRDNANDRDGQGRRGRSAWRGGFGLAAFCADNDQNQDGKVTHAELDGAIAKRFSLASHGAASMSFDQYMSEEDQRFREANARTFNRLDKDGDGKLTLAEFASSELRLFARLDKNKDGILFADEMKPRFVARGNRGRRPRGQSASY